MREPTIEKKKPRTTTSPATTGSTRSGGARQMRGANATAPARVTCLQQRGDRLRAPLEVGHLLRSPWVS